MDNYVEYSDTYTTSSSNLYQYDEVRNNKSWAHSLPIAQGLYDPTFEKDSCGVGFVCNIKGKESHKIVSDANFLLCNMKHRGATSSDGNGDGAGILLSIGHEFFVKEFKNLFDLKIPKQGQYAIGNIFFKNDLKILNQSKETFEQIAKSLDLSILAWRQVPKDSTILGSTASSREPIILQPIVVLNSILNLELTLEEFNNQYDSDFQKKLYILRKQSTNSIGLHNWFYISSLSNKNIVYKGQLTPSQVYNYYYDLNNVDYKSHFALVHSRFSTNTFPSWDRAQPLRLLAHNGEINSLRGNKNWMKSREGVMISAKFGDDLDKIYPIIEEGGSDSAAIDNVLELLLINGVLSLPEAIMLLVPEAWENDPTIDSKKKAFYQWASCLMEPWDGPALLNFTDGRYVGAIVDRNGLRPCRYYVTSDDRIICGSEVGVIPIHDDLIIKKSKLEPGNMLLVDTIEGKIVNDEELKNNISNRHDYKSWLSKIIKFEDLFQKLPKESIIRQLDFTIKSTEDPRLLAFGYTFEQIITFLLPMAINGKEAVGSMGNDGALACLNETPVLIYDYFRQLFAQVTNPPLDSTRESKFMSLKCYIGPQGNLLEINPNQCNRFKLNSPILTQEQFLAISNINKVYSSWNVYNIDITFDKSEGLIGYIDTIERITKEASNAVFNNFAILILSDSKISQNRISISSLVAIGSIHHYLIRQKQRSKVAIIVETGEARDVHQLCCLLGYGADGIFPYLAMETIVRMNSENLIREEISNDKLISNYIHAINTGIYKVMAKMGISTLHSYKGAQIFEALGVDNSIIDVCFKGTSSRIKGITFEYLAQDAFTLHDFGYPTRETVKPKILPESGSWHWRDGGSKHVNDPIAIASLQQAVRNKDSNAFDTYTKNQIELIRDTTIRGLLELNYSPNKEISLDQVEPWTEIVTRCNTGAMSYGSISLEAHSTLAIAMNRLNAKSNCGEGGDPNNSVDFKSQDQSMKSRIKQVASARFGVTSYYLSNCDELQIKIAQGAKPGQGGEITNVKKVTKEIAKTRGVNPHIQLISPPQHHDIYSIEDLKQLIYDLKCSNPRAGISVKLVSELGVGIVASGVAKAKADHILISGHDGGTGASPVSSILNAGSAWELGLCETQQSLVLNDLRGNLVLQTDGQLRTAFDLAVAILLGAESFTFATVPLITMGCIMMRKCHLNTCPVGIATQDPILREKFQGAPEHVINFFYYVINDLRKIMAKLGYRSVDEMIGHSEELKMRSDLNLKNCNIDLSPILTPAHQIRPGVATHYVKKQDHKLHLRLDNKFIDEAEITLEKGLPVTIDANIVNTDRAVGTTLSYRVSKRFGPSGLPEDTIIIQLKGNAGQSFGAYLAPGITLNLVGDANDYVGKGLSGGKLVLRPPENSRFKSYENVIAGNVNLFGATSGKAFFGGIVGERFAVRNSGATIVVDKILGNNAFEYMTGGRAVVLSQLESLNAFAGCSGGIIYVLVSDFNEFSCRINHTSIELTQLVDPIEVSFVRNLIQEHYTYTKSGLAEKILNNFNHYLKLFIKVLPIDYKNVLLEEAKEKANLKRKESETFLKSLQRSDPEADATNGEIKNSISNHSTLHEPKLLDLEDTIIDKDLESKKVEKLDKARGFIKYKVRHENYRSPKSRTKDWKELSKGISKSDSKYQTARCMDCGVPFCQSDTGCPISNIIPKFNELVFNNQWKLALEKLSETNNFPEFTGRVCPAPCQGACTLGIIDDPVGIKSVERLIIDNAFEQGWVVPNPPSIRSGKRIAIVGSGPAGLAAADQLNKAGHYVTIFERNDRPGGLLMYGIPNMKLDKSIVKRRTDLLEAEGIKFQCNTTVDNIDELKEQFDAVILAIGSTIPRDLKIPGRDLKNVDFAMELLTSNTKALLDNYLNEIHKKIEGKSVIVIGGGDTGNDCIGTTLRHGAKSIVNFELLPQPSQERSKDNPWPQWPRVFRIDYGHSEVKEHYGKDPREYCILSKEFIGDDKGNVKSIKTVRVEWQKSESGGWQMNEIPNSEEIFEADLVLLSMGFVGPEILTIPKNNKGNIKTKLDSSYQVENNVFTAGDCRRGQSLIVWAIQEGRQAAREVDLYLLGNTRLPSNGGIQRRDFKLLEELAEKV
ncbi:hypothetical protein WICMUC_005133 [Wickerhamomyces mucosus]|uniref:glutamate synthase (NADH) n=1 Tax=Wickerhamomyces mucosus TaxID=1378264 RepID=A0A9P8P9Y8_9ASCO|nr:hypothetical protein WICMUC_005133 [Wickerhamomyces mucosus]